MPVTYECEICGGTMAGWRCLSIEIPEDPGSQILFRVAACWTCRQAITELARNELLFGPLFLQFLRIAKGTLQKFKESLGQQPQ